MAAAGDVPSVPDGGAAVPAAPLLPLLFTGAGKTMLERPAAVVAGDKVCAAVGAGAVPERSTVRAVVKDEGSTAGGTAAPAKEGRNACSSCGSDVGSRPLLAAGAMAGGKAGLTVAAGRPPRTTASEHG